MLYRLCLRGCEPFVMRAHHRDDTAAGIGGGFKFLTLPLHQSARYVVAFRFAIQDLTDVIAVMRKVGVKTHEAAITRFVNTSDNIPGRWRRLVVDAQIALAATLNRRMRHIDGDALRLTAAGFPYFRSGKTGSRNRGLRRSTDAKRRRKHWLRPGQCHGIER